MIDCHRSISLARSSTNNSKIKQTPWISWTFIVSMAVKQLTLCLGTVAVVINRRRCYFCRRLLSVSMSLVERFTGTTYKIKKINKKRKTYTTHKVQRSKLLFGSIQFCYMIMLKWNFYYLFNS